MKKTTLFALLLLLGLGASCSSTKSTNNTKENLSGKTKVTMDTIEIQPLGKSEYKIKVGQTLVYSYSEHPSVGSTGEYEVGDKAVLVFKEQKRAYKNPKNSEMPGGDEAMITLVFEGGKVGNSSLTLRNMFRGKTENEFELKVIVE